VAEPWTDDFAALGERSRTQLRSLAASRAHVLSQPETKMRLLKNRPVLAVLLLLALVGAASGAVYAVDRVFLTVDPDKSAPEIEQDVKAQLKAANIEADVHAQKDDDNKVEVRILSSDDKLPDKLGVTTPDGDGGADGRRLRLEAKCHLDDAQMKELTTVASSHDMVAALMDAKDDAETIAQIKRALDAAGFHDVEVTTSATEINVTVKSPPQH
jgi:hypothetical protein